MKKKWIAILGIALSVSLLGCQPKEEPIPTPPAESPQEVAAYPYNEIGEGDITAFEILQEGEKTPIVEEDEELIKVAKLIQEAEFVKVAENPAGERQWGMTVYFDETILESKRARLSYIGNQLFIGPNGQEYLINSPELVDYIKDYQKGKIVIVDEKAISEGAKEWFGQYLQEKGAYIYQHPEATYVKVVTEQKPTGGYSIHIREFKNTESPQQIIIEIKEPEPNEMVTEAISFPSAYFKIDSEKADQYEVKTIDGEVYESKNQLVFAMLEQPEEGAKIDNPVRIKGKILAFEAGFVVRIYEEDGRLLHEENLTADYGGPNWGNFDEEITYPQPTTSRGRIELGEFSAKDGAYQLREMVEVRFK